MFPGIRKAGRIGGTLLVFLVSHCVAGKQMIDFLHCNFLLAKISSIVMADELEIVSAPKAV